MLYIVNLLLSITVHYIMKQLKLTVWVHYITLHKTTLQHSLLQLLQLKHFIMNQSHLYTDENYHFSEVGN